MLDDDKHSAPSEGVSLVPVKRTRQKPRRLSGILLQAALAALLLAAGSLPHQAAAYRFLGFGPHNTVVTASSWPPFVTWDSDFWPLGESVEVGIVEDPTWGPAIFERVKRLTEDALGYWSEIETRISISLSGWSADEGAENGLFVTLTDEGPLGRARGGARIRRIGERIILSRCEARFPITTRPAPTVSAAPTWSSWSTSSGTAWASAIRRRIRTSDSASSSPKCNWASIR